MKTLVKVKSDRRVRKRPRFCCISTKSCIRCLCPFFNFNWTSVIHCCPLAPLNQYVIPPFSPWPIKHILQCAPNYINYTHAKWECWLCDLLLLCFVVVRYLDVKVFMLGKLDHWSWKQRFCLLNYMWPVLYKEGHTGFVCFCLWHPLSSPSGCGAAIPVSVLVLLEFRLSGCSQCSINGNRMQTWKVLHRFFRHSGSLYTYPTLCL